MKDRTNADERDLDAAWYLLCQSFDQIDQHGSARWRVREAMSRICCVTDVVEESGKSCFDLPGAVDSRIVDPFGESRCWRVFRIFGPPLPQNGQGLGGSPRLQLLAAIELARQEGPVAGRLSRLFVRPSDLTVFVERPKVLWARYSDAHSRFLDNATVAWPNQSARWFEDRAWIWLHYGATNLQRGELFEVMGMIAHCFPRADSRADAAPPVEPPATRRP